MGDELTEREAEMIQAAADGFTAEETAAKFGLSRSTVHSYLATVRLKLDATNTTHAVSTAIRRGLID